MSHTNSTTNYNLPQFVGTDKPAWLGDINPAMTAIDTAIKGAKDAGDTADGKATQAQAEVDALETTVGTLNTTVGTLSTTVTAQGGDINTNAINIQRNATAIESVAEHFNLTDFTSATMSDKKSLSALSNYVDFDQLNLTLAQNEDGSIFKLYGLLNVARGATSTAEFPKTAIPGLSGYYGIPTGLYLKSAPSSAFIVQGGALNVVQQSHTNVIPVGIWNLEFSIGSDAQIYIYTNGNPIEYFAGQQSWRTFYWACLYFAKDFGDDVIPQN